MRKLQSYGPSVAVLTVAVLVLLLGPVAVQRMQSAKTAAVVTLAQHRLDEDDILERINQATRSIAEMVEPSVVYIEAALHGPGGRFARSTGSGWVYSDKGFIVTNAHVVTRMDTINVQFSDGRLRSAQIVGVDPSTDIAVLKVSASGLVAAQRATKLPVFQGDRVFAFGSPFGFKFSMSEGIVSGLGRHAATGPRGFSTGYTNYIQTDAAINPGNSGGPLVDIKGRVVGMNTAIVTSPERSTNGDSEVTGLSGGIGFAIPLETIESVATQLIEHGEVLKGFLGVSLIDTDQFTAEERQRFGLTEGFGVLINGVTKGLPAAQAGIKQDDLIIKIDGKDTPTSTVLRAAISNRTPGDYVVVTIKRDGEEKDFRVRLAAGIPQSDGNLVPVPINTNDKGRLKRSKSSDHPF